MSIQRSSLVRSHGGKKARQSVQIPEQALVLRLFLLIIFGHNHIKPVTKILAMDPSRNFHVENLAMIDAFLGATPLTHALQDELLEVRQQVVDVDYMTQVMLASTCNDVVL